MGILIHPRLWHRQPPIGAQINLGHPLSRGLQFYLLYSQGGGVPLPMLPHNLKPTLATPGSLPSPAWKNAPGGTSLNHNSGFSYWFERGSYCEPNWVTVVSRARRTGTLSVSAQLLCKTFNDNGSAPFISYCLSHNDGTSNSDQFTAHFADQSNTIRSGGSITPGANSLLNVYTAGMTLGPNGSSADLKTYFNGILKDTTNFAGTSGIGYQATAQGRLIAGGASGASTVSPWLGEIYFSAVYGRPLQAVEMEWLHAEPYAMLVPMIRRRYVIANPAPIIASNQPNVCIATF